MFLEYNCEVCFGYCTLKFCEISCTLQGKYEKSAQYCELTLPLPKQNITKYSAKYFMQFGHLLCRNGFGHLFG